MDIEHIWRQWSWRTPDRFSVTGRVRRISMYVNAKRFPVFVRYMISCFASNALWQPPLLRSIYPKNVHPLLSMPSQQSWYLWGRTVTPRTCLDPARMSHGLNCTPTFIYCLYSCCYSTVQVISCRHECLSTTVKTVSVPSLSTQHSLLVRC